MDAHQEDPVRIRLTLELDRGSRRLLTRSDSGSTAETTFGEEIEAALHDHLARICSSNLQWGSTSDAELREAPSSASARTPKVNDIERLGVSLGPYLFRGAIAQDLYERLRDAQARRQRLLVEVNTSDPFLRWLPWEAAVVQAPHFSGPACWCPGLVLARCHASERMRGLPMVGTLQVLTIIEDPAYREGDAEQLRDRVHQSGAQVYVAEHLRSLPWPAVAARLSDPNRNWHVLIYVGHVSERGSLAIAGEAIPYAEFARRVVTHNRDLRCVVLLGCSTWQLVADAFLEMGLPAVLGTHFYVPAGLVRPGLAPFLTTLATSGMVDSAYEALRDGLPDEDRATPVLCLRGEGTRLFGTGRDANRLGDYLRQMRHRLDDLVVWGQHHDSTRQKLYRHRTLLAQPQAIVAEAADDERTCTEDQIFDQLLSPAAGLRISILGDAGSGKTTLLDQIAWRFADRLLGTPDAQPRRIPFRIKLKDWDNTRPGTMEVLLCSGAEGLHRDFVAEILREGSAVVLLDGLDEVSTESRERLIQWLDEQIEKESVRHCSFVLACRPWAADRMPLRSFRTSTLTLTEFTWRDVEVYTHAYFEDADRVRQLLRHLESSSQMRQLVRRPLYLMIFCFAAEHGERVLSENEGQLLETSLRAMLQQRALPQEVCLRLLGRFAWDCWGNTRGRLTEAQAIGAIIETRKRDAIVADAPLPQHAEQLLSLIAEASGVLVRLNHSYAFATEIFIEYLVGRYLAELSITQGEALRELLTSHAWNPRWTRVFVFAMGRLWSERRELAWRVVLWLIAHVDNGRDDVWSTLTMLAARLLSPCEAPHDKTEERIANEVARMTIQAWRFSVHNRAGFASETAAHGVLIGLLPVAQKTIIDGLRAQLGDEHVGAAAAAALGLAATDEALQLLQETSVTGNTPAIRSAAVESLHRIGSNGARDWITRSLRDESHTVRHQAIRALQEAGDGDAIAALVSVLTEQGASVDSCVIEVLGAIRSSAAVDPLLELMADSSADPYIRTLGAEALGRIGATRAAEPLANVLRTANDTLLRDAALRGLAGIPSDVAVAAAIDVLHRRISASLFDAIRVLGICASDQAERALLHVLAHEEEGLLRSVVALALGKIGSSRAVHALVTALRRESEPQARRDIVYALGDTRSPDAVDVLLKAVGDADRVTSLLAGLALMPILGSDQAVTVLVGAMAHAEVQVRRNIPQVLAWLGSPAASPCKTDTYNVPIETAKELRWAVVQHGVTGLMQAISDSDAAVRTGAVEALRDLAPNRVLDSLLTCLTDSDARVRREAATALAKVDGNAAAGPLIAALVDAVPDVRRCAAGSLGALGCIAAEQALLELLADESPVVRSAAAKALGEIGASNAEGALIGLLTDQESIVRYVTAMALGHVGTEAAVERLIETLGDPVGDVRWQAADALGAIGSDRGVEPLIRALTDPDTLARKAAAHALGRIGSVKALTPLLNMLDDANKDNRAWAARALGMIGDKKAVGSLLAHLTDREYINFVDLPTQVADVAADALAALGIDSILPKLVTDLVGEDFERATGAYRLLMRTKSPAVIVALVSALNDERGWAGHLLDKYQLQSGETVFIDGRVAREEALRLEVTLWPPL